MPRAKRKPRVCAKEKCHTEIMDAVTDMATHCSTYQSMMALFRLTLVVGHGLFELTRVWVKQQILKNMNGKTRSEYFSLGQEHVTTVCDADFCSTVFGEAEENINTFKEMVLINMKFLYRNLFRTHTYGWSHHIDDAEGIRVTSVSTAVSKAVGGDDKSNKSVFTDDRPPLVNPFDFLDEDWLAGHLGV